MRLMSWIDSASSHKRSISDRKPSDSRRNNVRSATKRKMLAEGRLKKKNAFIKSALIWTRTRAGFHSSRRKLRD